MMTRFLSGFGPVFGASALRPRGNAIAAVLCLGLAAGGLFPIRDLDAADQAMGPLAPQIAGFLKTHCISCHGAKDPKAGLSLQTYQDGASLIKGRKAWQQIVDMVREGVMPPEEKPRPAMAESDAFLKAVAEFYEHADKNAKPDPGRVTVRRLNRAEYNNTVRDLFGVDIKPAEDFPSDDVGHGFDNIGDVLTLSPVLMERYLAAAENIAQRVIRPNPPKPTIRSQNCKYVEPAGGNMGQSNFRPISNEKPNSAIESGPLHLKYEFEPENEYIFKARMYTVAPKDVKVRVAILAAGKGIQNGASDEEADQLVGAAVKNLRPFVIVHTQEITASSGKTAEIVKVDLPKIPGVERMAVALFKTPDALIQPMLFVEYFSLEGPLDSSSTFATKDPRGNGGQAAGRTDARDYRSLFAENISPSPDVDRGGAVEQDGGRVGSRGRKI